MQIQTIKTWSEIDLERHIFFNLSNEINQLIQPLITHFNLDTFNYHKTYNDNSHMCLTNMPSWRRYYSINKLYQQSIFELPAHSYKRNRIITSNIDTHSTIIEGAAKFGIKSVITFIEPASDGCEFYFLGSSIDNKSVINKYLSNFSLLEKFIANFHEAAKDLFAVIEPQRLIIEDRKENKLTFNADDNIEKFTFLSSVYGYKFTHRELDCIPLLLRGLSAKQIAEQLKLSYRTVEVYIDNLKHKTHTNTKNELLFLLSEKFA